jgi:hypothetical protein
MNYVECVFVVHCKLSYDVFIVLRFFVLEQVKSYEVSQVLLYTARYKASVKHVFGYVIMFSLVILPCVVSCRVMQAEIDMLIVVTCFKSTTS